jgi:hypothetical protein
MAVMYKNRRVYFASSYTGTSGQLAAIWSIKDGKLALENTMSTGETGTGALNTLIPVLLNTTNAYYYAGFKSQPTVPTTTYGMDKLSTTRRNTSYSAYFLSPFMRVGSLLNKKAFSRLEIQLAKPLASNEGVKLEYRTSHAGSWTTMVTFATAGKQSYINHPDTCVMPVDIENIQFKVSLTTPSASDSTPELLEVSIS